MTDGSDDELMQRVGFGDRAAFAELVSRYLGRAEALAGRITGNSSDAEEIVQEAFLRTWLKAPEWEAHDARSGRARFSTWFYRVLVNLCIDRRRRPRPVPLEAAAHVADPDPGAFDRLARDESARRVKAALARLPERQRAALALCHFEEMSNLEAATVLEVSVGALESLLVRARRNLRHMLADLARDFGNGKKR
jgi:RNA polymerase sigma-70 factor (ECF subfamily)